MACWLFEKVNPPVPRSASAVRDVLGSVLPELKVVKQTVMTSVYGVTFVGARKQIQNVLGDKIIQRTEGSGVSVAINRSVQTGDEARWAVSLRLSYHSYVFPTRL